MKKSCVKPLRDLPDYGEDDSNPFARTASHHTGCLMAVLPISAWRDVETAGLEIAREDLLPNEDAPDGLTNMPHVSIQYGVECANSKVDEFFEKDGKKFVQVEMLAAHVFENEDSWALVMKCDVDDPAEFKKEFCRSVPHVDESYECYTPHVTVAYLKPGVPYDAYVQACNEFLSGKKFKCGVFAYSDANGKLTLYTRFMEGTSSIWRGSVSPRSERGVV